jgi:hypothetical protein
MRTSSPCTSSKRKPASDSRSRSSAVQRTGSAHVAIVDDVMLPSFDITHSADNIIVQRVIHRQGGAGGCPQGYLPHAGSVEGDDGAGRRVDDGGLAVERYKPLWYRMGGGTMSVR